MKRLPSETHLVAWRTMALVHQALVDVLESGLLAERDIDFATYDVLVTLGLNGGSIRMHELAAATLISRSSATRLIDRIEKAGLVERRICPSDRRGMTVSLTTAGKKVQRGAAPAFLRILQEHFARYLSDDEAAVIAGAMESVLSGEGLIIPAHGALRSPPELARPVPA